MADPATLAAAIGGPVVGLGGVFVAYRGSREERVQARALSREQREHERQLAHDARLFERRSSVYEDMLAYAHRSKLAVERTNPVRGRPWADPPGFLPDEQYVHLEARVDSFGSPAVLAALATFEQQVREFFDRAGAVREQEKQGGKLELTELQSKRKEVRAALRSLGEAVRIELTAP